jgi:hypothetical protein
VKWEGNVGFSLILGILAVVMFLIASFLAFGVFAGAPDPLGLVALGLASATLARMVP